MFRWRFEISQTLIFWVVWYSFQVNRQSQRYRRIQRRADVPYPLVSGPLPLPKGVGAGVGGGLTGALLGVGVSGASMSAGSSITSNGGLPAAGLTQPCSCQQCMLVLSVKANTGGAGGAAAIQTLGRRSLTIQRAKNFAPVAIRPLSPSKSATLGRGQQQNSNFNSNYYQTLPHGLAITKNTASPRQNAQLFAQSLAALTASASSMGISVSSSRPPPPSLPPPQPPSSNPSQNPPSIPPKLSSSSATNQSVPTATLITPASGVTTPPSPVPSPSPVVMKPQRTMSSAATVCHAPLPQRSSLAGLSRPALQRIAMAQSRALIASGWVEQTLFLLFLSTPLQMLSEFVQTCRNMQGQSCVLSCKVWQLNSPLLSPCGTVAMNNITLRGSFHHFRRVKLQINISYRLVSGWFNFKFILGPNSRTLEKLQLEILRSLTIQSVTLTNSRLCWVCWCFSSLNWAFGAVGGLQWKTLFELHLKLHFML